jgi:hypothetical protein
MAFSSGTISTRRFAVLGKSPKLIDQEHIERLSANALAPDDDGVPEEVAYGWNGGRHILDQRFDFEHNVFNDALSFAMRVDTNRVPSEVKKAYQIMEEDAVAAGNPSGFISKKLKKEVKETLSRKLDKELKTGKFRRSKLTPVLWDTATKTVYSPASGGAAEKLMELFERSFSLELEPLSAGTAARNLLESRSRLRDYEDMRPTRFVLSTEGDNHYPEYPWTAKGPQPKDFLGNEFLLWLWHEADHRDGTVAVDSGKSVTIFLDKMLDLDCAYGQSGRDGLRGTGPGRMPEARDGLRSGKVPRKAGLILDAAGQQFTFTLNAESLMFSGLKLPEVEEADTPRTLFEERVTLLRDLSKSVDSMFDSFLKIRCSSAWESHAGSIRKWIFQSQKPIAAVA